MTTAASPPTIVYAPATMAMPRMIVHSGPVRIDGLDHHAARVQRTRGVDEQVGDDREAAERVPGPPVEPAFQELRHGVDLAAQVDRKHEQRCEDQDDRRHPLVVVDVDTGVVPGGEPDERTAGHVGGQQREADERPDEVATAQEVALGVFVAPATLAVPVADADGDDEIRDDDNEVEGLDLEVLALCEHADVRRSHVPPVAVDVPVRRVYPSQRIGNDSKTTFSNMVNNGRAPGGATAAGSWPARSPMPCRPSPALRRLASPRTSDRT